MGFTPEQGLGEAMLAGESQRPVDVGADAREPLEIAVDDGFAFFLRDAKPAGDAPRGNAVQDREIDRLGFVAGVAINGSEQFLGGHIVDVLPGPERRL